MGNKQEARNTMTAAGVPVIPGSTEPIYDAKTGAAAADQIGYPVIVKAALGGGGKGMRVAETPEDFENSFQHGTERSPDGLWGRHHVYRAFCPASPAH